MNKVILHGRLGQDPQTKTFDNGQVTNFSLATDESYKNKDGVKVEKTEWHNIVASGKLSEVAERFFKKGSELLIEGKLRTRSWEQNGEKKYITEVQMTGFDFCGSREEKPQPRPKDYAPVDQGGVSPDDDLPFAPIDSRL